MKYLKYFFSVTLIVSIGLTSCKKNEENNHTPPAGNGSMTAKINGSNFESTQEASATYKMGTLLVSGSNENGQIQLSIWNPDHVTGDFDIGGDGGNTGIYVHSSDINQNYYSYIGDYTGNIKLSEFSNTKAKGSFDFKAGNLNGDKVNISDGDFDVELVEVEY